MFRKVHVDRAASVNVVIRPEGAAVVWPDVRNPAAGIFGQQSTQGFCTP